MIDASELKCLPVNLRRELIFSKIDGYDYLDDLNKAQAVSSVINTFIDEYISNEFEHYLRNHPFDGMLEDAYLLHLIDEKLAIFIPRMEEDLEDWYQNASSSSVRPNNVFEMVGASKLTFSNQVVRSLNAKLGLFWEGLASLSPLAVNPETEFGIKIKGVDLIAKNIITGNVEYQQVKTQRNTLTGSQRQRAVNELDIHDVPVFCACFSNNNWTFNHPSIERASGEKFWSRIGIDYNLVVGVAERIINHAESKYVEIISK